MPPTCFVSSATAASKPPLLDICLVHRRGRRPHGKPHIFRTLATVHGTLTATVPPENFPDIGQIDYPRHPFYSGTGPDIGQIDYPRHPFYSGTGPDIGQIDYPRHPFYSGTGPDIGQIDYPRHPFYSGTGPDIGQIDYPRHPFYLGTGPDDPVFPVLETIPVHWPMAVQRSCYPPPPGRAGTT